MIKKVWLWVLLVVLIAGCGNIQSEISPPVLTITDALDREVTFNEYPDQIVIAGRQTPMLANFAYLFKSNTDKIIAIENRTQSADQFLTLVDDQYSSKVVIERGAGAEQIAPFEPDAVILKSTMKAQIGDQLETVGIHPVYVSFETIEEIYRDVRILGTLFNDPEKVSHINAFYKEKKSFIDDLVDNEKNTTDVLLLQAKEIDGNYIFSVPPTNWLQTAMATELQANPVWVEDVESGGWMDVNIEQIIRWEPELILIINYQGKAPKIIESLQADGVWTEFLADKGTVLKPFIYDFQSWDQPDPRWILGYASLAYYFYPDVIDEEIMYEMVRDFYQEMYGVGIDVVDTEVIPIIAAQIQ